MSGITKPWTAFDPGGAKRIPGTVGVYEIGDEAGKTLYIGCAGGREPFGLRGKITGHFTGPQAADGSPARPRAYRYEVNLQYLTRWIELLTQHLEAQGGLPQWNERARSELPRLGRFHRAAGVPAPSGGSP